MIICVYPVAPLRRFTPMIITLLVAVTACDGSSEGDADVSPGALPYSEWIREDEAPAAGPECYGAQGSAADGTKLAAALRLRRDDSAVWGSYTVGPSANEITTYTVTGTVRDSEIDAEFRQVGGATMHVDGLVTSTGAELVDPTGTLPLTSLLVGCD